MIYYVDQSARMEGSGTKERPFRHINDAARVARPGDEVLVYPGIYREYVNPLNGGTEENRIVYRSVEPLGAVITGAEIVTGWEQVEGTVWKKRINNQIFGSFNPYVEEVYGDWYFAPTVRHTGCVYLNDRAMYEALTMEEVKAGEVYKPSWEPEYSIYKWFPMQDGKDTVLYCNFQDKNPNEEKIEINSNISEHPPVHINIFIVSFSMCSNLFLYFSSLAFACNEETDLENAINCTCFFSCSPSPKR